MSDEALVGTELYAWLSRHYFTYDYLCGLLADNQVSTSEL